jgi:hypothetical protein
VCLVVSNWLSDTLDYSVQIAFERSGLPHFGAWNVSNMVFQSSVECLTLISQVNNNVSQPIHYTLLITSLNPADLIEGQMRSLVVIVMPKQFTQSALSTKSIQFIAYDNDIDAYGSDRVAVMNMVPIYSGMFFMLTSAQYDTVNSIGIWEGKNREAISIATIRYTGQSAIQLAQLLNLQ